MFFGYLLCGAADSLLAYLADVLIACLVCLAFLVARLGELYHDELSVSAVLGIKLHYCVGCGGGAGEEVEDNSIIIIYNVNIIL